MTATRWWWIRHAPVPNPGGRLYGRNNVDADVSDTAALAALAALLPRGAAWVSSPLKRTRQTAAALAQAFADTVADTMADTVAGPPAEGPVPVIEPDLIEQDFGAWQGLTYGEIDAQLGARRPAFWLAPADVTPPDGESFTEVVARVSAAIRRLTARYPGRDIVAIAHGGTIRAALAMALMLEPETALRFCVDTLSLTRLDHISGTKPKPKPKDSEDGGKAAWRVVTVNQIPMNHPRAGNTVPAP